MGWNDTLGSCRPLPYGQAYDGNKPYVFPTSMFLQGQRISSGYYILPDPWALISKFEIGRHGSVLSAYFARLQKQVFNQRRKSLGGIEPFKPEQFRMKYIAVHVRRGDVS